MIDSATDIHIDGILPMVVARNTDSGMDTSRVFGPGWNTTLDCRIEIFPDQVLMMTPDGHCWSSRQPRWTALRWEMRAARGGCAS